MKNKAVLIVLIEIRSVNKITFSKGKSQITNVYFLQHSMFIQHNLHQSISIASLVDQGILRSFTKRGYFPLLCHLAGETCTLDSWTTESVVG